MADTRKIALFGGTFDPVHCGHLHLAELAKTALALDEVRFIPCRISPHKTGSQPASAHDRCKMLRLATADLPWAVVDDFELQQPGPSFSWQTATAMAEKFPESRLFWIMGGDQWKALPTWKHPEILAELVEFIVLARGKDVAEKREGFRMSTITGEHPASASELREIVARGTADHPWLHPDVSAWIEKHGLYR